MTNIYKKIQGTTYTFRKYKYARKEIKRFINKEMTD